MTDGFESHMKHAELVQKPCELLQAHDRKTYPAVHLFGILYADDLEGQSSSLICEEAGISKNYGTEISKGRRLAPYVEVKQ
jgi:hypothetical protein